MSISWRTPPTDMILLDSIQRSFPGRQENFLESCSQLHELRAQARSPSRGDFQYYRGHTVSPLTEVRSTVLPPEPASSSGDSKSWLGSVRGRRPLGEVSSRDRMCSTLIELEGLKLPGRFRVWVGE